MSFESARDRWANLPFFVRVLILIGAAAGLGFGVVKPGYGAFKAWKLSGNLAKAEKAIEESRMGDARDLSLTVLKSGDTRIEVFRILEKATASLGDPHHGEIAKALLTHPKASDEDRWKGFRGIVDEMPLGVVSQVWSALPENCRLQSRFAAAFATRVIPENRLPEATTVLLAVPADQRTEELNRVLIRVLIHTGKEAGFDEAQHRIAAHFAGSSEDRAEWLVLLEQLPVLELQPDFLGPVRQALGVPELAEDARSQLMLARINYAADASLRAEIVQAAIARWQKSAPEPLGHFLTDLGLYQELSGLFPSTVISANLDLLRRVLQAMEKTADWKAMLSLLDSAGQKMPKYEESAYRTVVAARMGDGPTKVQRWADALGEAKSSGVPDALLVVGRIVREAGMLEEADQALLEAIKSGRGPLPLFTDLGSLTTSLEKQERESVLMEIYAIYIPFEPGNPELFTRYAYLACLNRLVEPGLLLDKLELLSKSFPKEAMLQWVLATVYLCDGKPGDAAKVFDQLEVGNLDDHVSGFRIAYLATQVMNKRIPASDPRIRDFPWTTLKTSERKRFNDLIQSAPH